MDLLSFLRLADSKKIANLDHPSTVEIHRKILNSKPALQDVYRFFYQELISNLPESTPGPVVELGSGAGFLKSLLPEVITSDIVPIQGVDMSFAGEKIPFENSSVRAFVMVDVFHHIADTSSFLREVERCLRPGGTLIMLEPANTCWSRFVFSYLHHEAFDPKAPWGLTSDGPLSSANGALPWIVFERDADSRLLKEHPSLKVARIHKHSPFKYLLSGGLSFHSLLPWPLWRIVNLLELFLTPANNWVGMFSTITVTKQ
jgi:SAM-dependent methyltransferase